MLEMAHNYAKGGTTGIAITALALAGVDLLRRGGLGGFKEEAQIKELKEDVHNLTRFFNITPTFVTAPIPAVV